MANPKTEKGLLFSIKAGTEKVVIFGILDNKITFKRMDKSIN